MTQKNALPTGEDVGSAQRSIEKLYKVIERGVSTKGNLVQPAIHARRGYSKRQVELIRCGTISIS